MNITPISFLTNKSNLKAQHNLTAKPVAQSTLMGFKSQELLASYVRPIISFKGENPEDFDKITILQNATDDKGKPRFENFHIENIMSVLTEENKDCLLVLLDAKKDNNKEPRFSANEIIHIMTNLTANNADSLSDMLKGNDSGYIIAAKLNSTK